MTTNTQTQSIRPGQKEQSFRAFELAMFLAIQHGVHIVNPAPRKPSTWLNRFNEAKLGFRRFRYKSTVIPASVDVGMIKATEQTDGTVVLRYTLVPAPAVSIDTSGITTIANYPKPGTATQAAIASKPAVASNPNEPPCFECNAKDIEQTLASVGDAMILCTVKDIDEFEKIKQLKEEHQNIVIVRK